MCAVDAHGGCRVAVRSPNAFSIRRVERWRHVHELTCRGADADPSINVTRRANVRAHLRRDGLKDFDARSWICVPAKVSPRKLVECWNVCRLISRWRATRQPSRPRPRF